MRRSTVRYCLICGGRTSRRTTRIQPCTCTAQDDLGTTGDARAAERIRELRDVIQIAREVHHP